MHTPGPWKLDDQSSPLVCGQTGPYIAQVFGYDNGDTGTRRASADADARLIANAPALLASLRQILADLEDSDFAEDFADTIQAARAAIEAATGDDLAGLPPGALECRVTSDGYRLYRIASGEWVDDVRPEWRDMTFDAFPDEVSDESRSFGPWGQR